jgi:hypothetical protein
VVRAAIVLVGLGIVGTARAQVVQDMTPERIREALEWGVSASETELSQYDLRTDKTWLVNFDTPFLRVAQFSRAMKIQNSPATEGDVSPKLAAPEVHLYAHARQTAGGGPLPNIEYVMVVRPRPDGAAENLLPTSLQSFVRRVPRDEDVGGPTRIARSVKASFPMRALAAGNEVRLTFEGGIVQSIPITAEALGRVR